VLIEPGFLQEKKEQTNTEWNKANRPLRMLWNQRCWLLLDVCVSMCSVQGEVVQEVAWTSAVNMIKQQ
jgi:hypothetical protein